MVITMKLEEIKKELDQLNIDDVEDFNNFGST